MTALSAMKEEAKMIEALIAECVDSNGDVKCGQWQRHNYLMREHREIIDAINQWKQWKKEGWLINE